MRQSKLDIEELAEDLGNRFLVGGKVDLHAIARKNHIHFIEGNYGNHFLGQLVHFSRKFYIILNSDLLSKSESGRIRFTIAHELGHYFIDSHRTRLAKGISLSFKGELSELELKQVEVVANHFAANLLMPKSYFITAAKKLEPGLAAVLTLKTKFDTSIESTANQYVKLNISTNIMIKWKADYTFHYAWYSRSFSNLTGIRYYPAVRLDSEYIKGQSKLIDSSGDDFVESATQLSRWISSIAPRSRKDFIGLEQTLKLGEFGGITLLTFEQ